tara:strand:+ start:460 stop:645 length:186 start_codon:yes stop_codon:yes gene_type:complete
MELSTIEKKTVAVAIWWAVETYTDIIESSSTCELDKTYYQGQRYVLRNLVEKITDSIKEES